MKVGGLIQGIKRDPNIILILNKQSIVEQVFNVAESKIKLEKVPKS